MNNRLCGLEGLAAHPELVANAGLAPQQIAKLEQQRKAALKVAFYLAASRKAVRTIEAKGRNKVFQTEGLNLDVPLPQPVKVWAAPKPAAKPTNDLKCPHCGMVTSRSFNLKMHLEAKHREVPPGTICDFGCGKPAKHSATKERFCCEQHGNQCSAVLERSTIMGKKTGRGKKGKVTK